MRLSDMFILSMVPFGAIGIYCIVTLCRHLYHKQLTKERKDVADTTD